jgi:hypothetical protein
MDRAYGPDFYAGDEDNGLLDLSFFEVSKFKISLGEMGAWFVMSALGLFAAAPGASDEYVIGM